MDPPGYVDIEECEDKNDSTEDGSDDLFESRDPKRYFRRGLLDGKSRIGSGLGAVVGLDVGWRC